MFAQFHKGVCKPGHTVLSYGLENETIITFFVMGTVFRICSVIFSITWALDAKNQDQRILFASLNPWATFIVCCYKIKDINFAMENEYLQGFPWLLDFLDTAFVAGALAGVAFGANPFPGIPRGKSRYKYHFLAFQRLRASLGTSFTPNNY